MSCEYSIQLHVRSQHLCWPTLRLTMRYRGLRFRRLCSIPRVFPCVPRVFPVCSPCVPRVFPVCSPCVPRVFPVCSPCVPRVFRVFPVCSPCVPVCSQHKLALCFPGLYSRHTLNTHTKKDMSQFLFKNLFFFSQQNYHIFCRKRLRRMRYNKVATNPSRKLRRSQIQSILWQRQTYFVSFQSKIISTL